MPVLVPDPVRARIGVSLLFFTNGFALANLLPRYPELKAAFELTNTGFGLLVAMFPLGAIIASTLPAPLIRRFGAAPVAFGTTVMLACMFGAIALAPHVAVLGIAMALAGFADAITDAAMNVHGLLVEDYYGKSIVNSLHALWSLGAVAGGALGAWAASISLGLGIHLISATVIGVVIAAVAVLLAAVPAAETARTAHAGEHAASGKLSRPALMVLLPLCTLGIVGVLPEEAAMNWGALYLGDIVGTSAGITGLGFVAMISAQTVGRFLGDPATDRWGAAAVVRFGGVLIAVGGVLIVAFPVLPAVLIGFALTGLGCASVVPAAYAAAGRLPGLPEGTGVTIASWLLRIGFLVVSPVVGVVSDLTSLRVALSLLVVSGLAVVMLAPRLRPTSSPVV